MIGVGLVFKGNILIPSALVFSTEQYCAANYQAYHTDYIRME